ncbi:MAG: serine protease [Cyanobacteria bacterium J06648_1]
MKWPPNQGFKNQGKSSNSYSKRSIFHPTSQVIKMIFCFVCTGMFLSGDGDRLRSTIASVSPQELVIRLNQIAANISVRILNQDFLGSGFIVRQAEHEYLVITNQHVLRAGEAPYRVETVDGRIHAAKVITEMNTANYQYDLAVLKFTAKKPYQTAKIGNSLNLQVGQPVFAAGFPYQESSSSRTPAIFANPNLSNSRKLALKSGRIAIILNQALEEGYQIGYTNDVKKGMSGGALLNERGEVIGVNGKHAYPLWESPEIYQDGSEPCPALQELITRSSLAIPIEKSIELAAQLKSIKSISKNEDIAKNSLSENSPLVSRMQAIAKETKRQCRQQQEAILEDQ